MKIVILGAGALGTVLGAHLARAGEDVTLMARGNRAAYLQARGATLTGLMDFTVPVTVVTDPHQVQDADALIITVKTYDMAAALASVQHLRVGSVVSIQNGVLKNEQLAQTFGWGKVMGAMAWFSAEVLSTGAVRFTVQEGFYLGALPEGISPGVQTLVEQLSRAGIVVQVTPAIRSFEWSKYVVFTCLMAPAVLTRLATYQFLQDEQIASITASVLHEMAHLARTMGIPFEDLGLFPTKQLSGLTYADTVTALRQIGDQFASRAPTHKVSTLQDLEQGKRLEVEETLGYAVRKGAELGVPTPTMDTCYKLIAGINHALQ